MKMGVMKRLRKRLWEKKGQNTVEYLMMLAVIVGIVLMISRLFKNQLGGVFTNVMGQIQNAVGTVSKGNE